MREDEGRIGQVFRLERRNGWIGQVQVRVDEGRIGVPFAIILLP